MFHYKKQLDELAQFKNNNKMTRSLEKTYLEKCRDFVEMMAASESLVSMSENDKDKNIINVDRYNIQLTDDMINICNEYQQYCQQECRQILDKYESDIGEYCKLYENQLNKYYTDYTNTILWDYYNNTTKKLESMHESLITKNHNLSIEYKEIYRRLLIMISEYNKLYNEYHKTKNVFKKTNL